MTETFLIRVYKKVKHDPTRLLPVADIKVTDDHFWNIDLNRFAKKHGGDIAQILDSSDLDDETGLEVY